ncbi:eukaryotic translation initiation factor 3 subunit J [Gilbertella persicaria]|uniref:eukaryotic translation initiation factor 3 subunit J n=1 Tax=Gilbertella persicaria TaxID=101096 RepID=UPI00221F4D69|nr:eukaryotic translation initiation factor 3 subunit J [Gilbertella persicaria]KAI8075797.1 eukaryotic translation initiation factor 3 subunit J [Gilbertella persicaria]
MSDWEDEIDVQIAVPKKNQWDDEDAEDNVKESWEDSDQEETEMPKKAAPVIKKKVPLKQKIAEKQAAEEQKKKELEAKKLAKEQEPEESDYERLQRLRRLELEADMANATDLFSGVTVADMKDKPIEEWKPKNRVELDAYRKKVVEIVTAASKSINYGWFIDELLHDIAYPLKDTEVKKVASSLTVIANEKQRLAKEATKKGKTKGKPQLVAAGKNAAADDRYGDNDYDDYDDFM